MNTVKFGTIDSYDLGIVMESREIGDAEPKIIKVEVPFANGDLDLTDYFGDVRFNNRTIKMKFSVLDKVPFETYSAVCRLVNGQLMKLTFSDDPNFYYLGRASVSSLTKSKALYSFTVTADCKPFKFYQDEKVVTASPAGAAVDVTCSNRGYKVIPTIETTADINIIFGNNSYAINAGTHILTDIVLETGDNVLTISGTATVKIKYQEGVL